MPLSRDLKNDEMDTGLCPSRFLFRRIMETLRLFKINTKYITFLRGVDKKVQLNKSAKRPYIGIVLEVGGFRYFAPLESPKESHKNIKSAKHLLKIDNGNLGLIGFNNMIPVHNSALIEFDIDLEPDAQYAELLRRQALWINKNKATIYSHANKTYCAAVNSINPHGFYSRVCCDFKKLEKACKNYNPNYKKSSPKIKLNKAK